MGTIFVRGSLQSIQEQLQSLHDVIEEREASGYRILQHDENWMFSTSRDERVCPECRPFEGTMHRGDYIPHRFPDYQVWTHTVLFAKIHPNGRCVLEWLDVHDVILDRIHEEFMSVTFYV